MNTNALQLLGLVLAFIGGFALVVEILEKRLQRARTRRLRLIDRIYWPDPPPAQPRPFSKQDALRYAMPPRSSDLLPWR